MNMTEGDIVKEYKEAKYKRAQIDILADLNCCEPIEIKRILRKNGVDLRGGNGRRNARTDPEEQPKGCLKDKTGSCAGCTETDLCTEYVPEPKKPEAKPIIPDAIMIEMIKLGVEAVDGKIAKMEQEIVQLQEEIEELRTKRALFAEYGL